MDDNAEVETEENLDHISVAELAQKYKETAEVFRNASRESLKIFYQIEALLQGAANACIELAEMLDPPEPTNDIEGDSNAE